MSNLKTQLQGAIFKATKKLFPQLKLEEVQLEHPENEAFGDYSSNVAMRIKTSADKIVGELQKQKLDFIEKIEIKNNFINFFLKTDYLLRELSQVDEKYGQGQNLKSKKIMVEFCHPNTHKQFHIGHLRNICLAESIIRLLEFQGIQVIRANYQGDVGLHIAKAMYGLTWILLKEKKVVINEMTLNDIERLNKSLSEIKKKNQIVLLGKAYTKGAVLYEKDLIARKAIGEINKIIYNNGKDSEIFSKYFEIYQLTRQWSLDYFETIYKRVYSHYDRCYFESQVHQKGKEAVLLGLKKGIFKQSKGAIIFPGSKYGLHDRVFITSEGNPTYEAKDMELGRLQFSEHHPDLVVHIVGPEQAGYFQVVFKALAQLYSQTKDKEYHLSYGWVRLKKGKMSSRSGNVVTGPWLLDEAKKRIKKSFPDLDQKTAEKIAVGAVKYSFLKVNPQTEVAFDFDESIALAGNSGPYLQYAYARCQSVLAKAKKSPQLPIAQLLHYSPNDEEKAILRTFYKFGQIVAQASQDYSPNLLCQFLYDLCQKYNGFYNKHRIIGAKEQEMVNFRLALTKAVAQILQSGLDLLGIKTPEKM